MFEIGKIPPEILEKAVMRPMQESSVKRAEVLLRPQTGEDCSAVDFGGEYCVLSTDPITGAAADTGYLAVQVNCNDVYAAGAEPIGLLLTVLLPPGSGEDLLREIMDGAFRGAKERNIEILGGHTEVTDAVVKPVVSAAVVGRTRNRRILSTGGARPGQDILMTKWAGTEGTAILAEEKEGLLKSCLTAEELGRAKGMKECLSVGRESEIAYAHGAAAMHDATEGGILGAAWEMAECSGCGIEVFAEKIPVREETEKICSALGIDPLRLVSSGTMVIAADSGQALLEKLEQAGIPAAIIGRATESGRYILAGGEKKPLAEPESDALYGALKKDIGTLPQTRPIS